jgi:hypothetical protein
MLRLLLTLDYSPDFRLIVVGLDTTYRTMFANQPPTPGANTNEYYSIKPGDKRTTDFLLPAMMEPGSYNVCAEILIFGNSGEADTYDAELGSLKN